MVPNKLLAGKDLITLSFLCKKTDPENSLHIAKKKLNDLEEKNAEELRVLLEADPFNLKSSEESKTAADAMNAANAAVSMDIDAGSTVPLPDAPVVDAPKPILLHSFEKTILSNLKWMNQQKEYQALPPPSKRQKRA